MPAIYASAEMNVQVEYGFDGFGKQDKPIAVTITIKNDDRNFEGELVTTYTNNYLLQNNEVIPLKLGPNEVVTKRLYLETFPYEVLNQSSKQFIHVYNDSLEKGKEAENYEVEHIEPELASFDTFMNGVFGEKQLADSLQQLRAIYPNQGMDISHHSLDTLELVQHKTDLSMFNSILLTEPLADLNEQQQRVLFSWVQDGGQLVLNQQLTGTLFENSEALQYRSGTTTLEAQQLQQFVGQGNFTKPVTVQNGVPIKGAQSYIVNEKLVAAKQMIGSGALIQTAFSLTDPTLVQEDGYAYLMTKLVDFDMPFYTTTAEGDLSSNIVPANALFGSFEFSLWKIILIFSLYILILGPILYYFLKKKDKREYAWGIIPVIAIIVSIGLFLIGAKDRIMQPQIQQMAVVKIGDNYAEQYFAQSLLSNRSGDYQFELSEQMTIASYKNQFTQLRNLQDSRWSYITEQDNKKILKLKNVPYWDVESFVGHGPIDIGQLTIQLANENGHVTGTIENNLNVDVTAVQIWTGTSFLDVGDLKQGETKQVNAKLENTLLSPSILTPDKMYYDSPTPETIDDNRKGRLLAFANTLISAEQTPVVIAHAKMSEIGAKFVGKATTESMVLIVQPFTATMNFTEEVTVSDSAFQLSYSTDMFGGINNQYISGQEPIYLDPADYEVIYQLPQFMLMYDIKWYSLHYQQNGGALRAQIYNRKTEQYEPIDEDFSTQQIDNYLENGRIQFKWRISEAIYDNNMKLPTIELKGAMMQ